MDVVLVNPPGDILVDEHLEPPLGLLSIASYLQERHGIRARILDLTSVNPEEACRTLSETNADVFGFTVYCTKWKITIALVKAIREAQGHSPLIVAGGPNPTALPKETLECEGIDIVVCGEGEKAFARILTDQAEGRQLQGAKTIVRGERLQPGEFPYLDRSLVDAPSTYGRRCFGEPVVTLETSRGCPNACFFCNSVVMGGGSRGGIISKPAATVIREIRDSIEAGYRIFRFNDDTFSATALQNGLSAALGRLGVRYRIFATVGDLSEASLKKLRDSGCFHISIGIESYDPSNLALLGKQMTQASIRRVVRAAEDLGIIVRAYFIVGLPFDSDASVEEYMTRVCREVPFREYSVYPLIPYPGTRLWNEPETLGYTITDHDYNRYVQIGKGGRTCIALRHHNFDGEDIRRWLDRTEAIFSSHGRVQTFSSPIL